MNNQPTTAQKNQILFYQLIMTFQASAMQQMGKLKSPVTDKIERDMTQAQLSIDMIDMIKAKTEGNRTDDETNLIEQVLRELKLNYVDELDKDKKEDAEQKQEPVEKSKSGKKSKQENKK